MVNGEAPLISSPGNPRVKALLRLHRRRERDATGTFLIEGLTEIVRAAQAGVVIEGLYVREDAAPVVGAALAAAGTPTASVVRLGTAAFARAAYRETSEALAVARTFATGLDRIDLGSDPLVLVVEGTEKPGNLGAMLRTAAAAGATALVACDPETDLWNPNVVRASLGALFTVPVAVAGAGETIAWLHAKGMGVFPSSVGGRLPYWEADLTGATALVVGSEATGLSGRWLDDPGRVLVIPTPGAVSSLNASTAAALLLYEAVRQRRR